MKKISKISILAILSLFLTATIYFVSCVENKDNLNATEELSQTIKANVDGVTYEFHLTKNSDNSINVDRKIVAFDASAPSNGVFSNSNYLVKNNNKVTITSPKNIRHFYVPFNGSNPVELYNNNGDPDGNFECFCEENNGDELCDGSPSFCKLVLSGYIWTYYSCESNCCDDCDFRFCPNSCPALGDVSAAGIVIEAPSINLAYSSNERNAPDNIFLGGNYRIEVLQNANGTIQINRQKLLGSSPNKGTYNFSQVPLINGELVFDPNKSYWLIPFDENTGALGVGPGTTFECVSNKCEGTCDKEEKNGCITCKCSKEDGDCDMKPTALGVLVEANSVSITDF